MRRMPALLLLLLLLTACGPGIPLAAPTATLTPAPTLTPTATPTPRPPYEIAPEGTAIKMDKFDNRYTVDENGRPRYWWNSEANSGQGDWERFRPIISGEIPHLVYITSGFLKESDSPLINPEDYKPAFAVRNNQDFSAKIFNTIDIWGKTRLDTNGETLRNGAKPTPENDAFQPVKNIPMRTVKINDEEYYIFTNVIKALDEKGQERFYPIYYGFEKELYDKLEQFFQANGTSLWAGLYHQEDPYGPLTCNIVREFDRNKAKPFDEFHPKPAWFDIYTQTFEAVQKRPDNPARVKVLETLVEAEGPEFFQALDDLGNFVQPCTPVAYLP